MNASDSERGSTEEVIDISPVKRIPKPMKISPRGLEFFFFTNIIRIIPTTSAIGARVEGLKNSRIALPDESISIRRIICAVTVVPIFAPRTIHTACLRFKTPAVISPTVITIVAVDDWITAVTRAPVSTPMKAFAVTFSSTRFRAVPDAFLSPSPMISIPYRNIARPPSRVITVKIVIIDSCYFGSAFPRSNFHTLKNANRAEPEFYRKTYVITITFSCKINVSHLLNHC